MSTCKFVVGQNMEILNAGLCLVFFLYRLVFLVVYCSLIIVIELSLSLSLSLRFVHEVLAEALVHKVAVVFALNRRRLGAAVGKNARIAVVGIRDDGGANAAHEQVCVCVDAWVVW